MSSRTSTPRKNSTPSNKRSAVEIYDNVVGINNNEDAVDAIRITALINYLEETSRCIYLCKSADTNHPLQSTTNSLDAPLYLKRKKNSLMYLCTIGNFTRFHRLWSHFVCNDYAKYINTLCNDKGNSLWFLAVSGGNKDIVKELAGVQGNKNIQNETGDTALHVAVHSGSEAIVKYLCSIAPPIDMNIPNNEGNIPFLCAIVHHTKNFAIIDTLLELHQEFPERFDINRTNNAGDGALHIAYKTQNYKLIEKLLQYIKLDLNLPNTRDGNTLLGLAGTGSKDIMELILRYSEHLDFKHLNNQQQSVFHLACQKNQSNIIKQLVYDNRVIDGIIRKKEKSNVALLNLNLQDHNGNTGLMIAASLGHVTVVKILLAKFLLTPKKNPRINVNVKDTDGNTALHLAVLYAGTNPDVHEQIQRSLKIITLLLDSGIQKLTKNKNHQTALAIAESQNNQEIMEILSDN